MTRRLSITVDLAGDARAEWLTKGRKWVDAAPLLGIKRLMLNQGALTDDSKAGVISLWKELQDYARPKEIMISNETRVTGAPTPGGGRGGASPARPRDRGRNRATRLPWARAPRRRSRSLPRRS